MIPLPDAIVGFVQDELKKKYPGFGLWLFGSEIAAVTALLFIAREYAPFPLIYLAVRALMFRSYLRKHRKRGNAPGREAVFNVCTGAAAVGVVAGIFLWAAFADVPAPEDEGYVPASDTSADALPTDLNTGEVVMNATDDLSVQTNELKALADDAAERANQADADDDYCSVEEFEKWGCDPPNKAAVSN